MEGDFFFIMDDEHTVLKLARKQNKRQLELVDKFSIREI